MSGALSVMTGGDDVVVIEAIELSAKRRGRRVLDGVGFQVRPGQVTGLLGLPGSGKTTVLRRMLQLDPGGGRTLFDGRAFRALPHPMRSVGVLLDPLALHPARTVAGHLRLALSADPGAAPRGRRERIDAVLDVCGLTEQGRTRIADLTEGMTVRLGLAQALLGDPEALLLDEPDCGLEPEGRTWLAALLRAYATQGRCVLVSGRDTTAMVEFADRLLVLDGGRLLGQRTARQAVRELSGDCVIVRTPQVLRLAAVLVAAGAEPTQLDGACLEVRGLDRARIGDLAYRNEIPLHELSVRSAGDDPVAAVLEACRRQPAVVPVQAPPAGRVPEHPAPRVGMPFLAGLGGDGHGDEFGDGDGVEGGGLSRDLGDGGPNVRVLARPVAVVAESAGDGDAAGVGVAAEGVATIEALGAGNAEAGKAEAGNVEAGTAEAGNVEAETAESGDVEAENQESGNAEARIVEEESVR